MSSRSTRWPLGVLVSVLILAALAWPAWRAWQVDRSLSAVQTDAARLRADLKSGDDTDASRALAALQSHADQAARQTHGATWAALRHLPRYGDDASAVATVSAVLAELVRSGVHPLVATSTQPGVLLPSDGRVPVAALSRWAPSVASARTAFATADRQLADVDVARLHGPLPARTATLRNQVAAAGRQLGTADQALQLLPDMLGAKGPRDYLVVVQNNAEIRATGGLPGASLLVHVVDGNLTITRQATAGDFPVTARPVLPLTRAERLIYGSRLGRVYADAGLTPDFPRAAALWRAWWLRSYPQDRVDGVLTVDPVALSYLLDATGPIDVGPTTLTGANAVEALLHQAYLDHPDPTVQDDYFARVARDVFSRLTTDPGEPAAVLTALDRAVDDGRLRLYPFRTDDQRRLAGAEIEGGFDRGPEDSPQAGLYLDAANDSKLSYYLRYDAQVRATSCRAGVQQLAGAATLSSTAPSDAATLPVSVLGLRDVGARQLVAVHLYGPVDGSIGDVVLDGEPVTDVQVVVADGRPVASVVVALEPQQTGRLSWTMTTGPGQLAAGRLDVTPSVAAGRASSRFASAC